MSYKASKKIPATTTRRIPPIMPIVMLIFPLGAIVGVAVGILVAIGARVGVAVGAAGAVVANAPLTEICFEQSALTAPLLSVKTEVAVNVPPFV